MMGKGNWISMEDQKPNVKTLSVCVNYFKDSLNFDSEAIVWKNIQNLDKFLIGGSKRTRDSFLKSQTPSWMNK